MANKHTNQPGFKITYQKCALKGCKVKVKRTPCDVKDGDRRFCCRDHKNKGMKASKYTPEVVKWILANVNVISRKEMAAQLNTSPDALRKLLCARRKAGLIAPKINRGLPLGTIRTRLDRGKVRTYIKTEAGMKEVINGEASYKAPSKPAIKNAIPSKVFFENGVVEEKTKIKMPDGSYILCDSSKAEAVIKYLQNKEKVFVAGAGNSGYT